MLVEDGLARPAAGPVELHDQPPVVVQLDFVDPVLERAKRQAAARAAQAPHLDRVEHAVGSEGGEVRAGRRGDQLDPSFESTSVPAADSIPPMPLTSDTLAPGT